MQSLIALNKKWIPCDYFKRSLVEKKQKFKDDKNIKQKSF